jgi:crotonobetainyl-CoA:carnitine CoA-transferase CaiB-like acyl-CoA transferase
VPAGPINTLDAVFDDPQVRARGMVVDLPHPISGTVPLVANPLRLSETPVTYRSAPPPLGAQTHEVLAEFLDMPAAAIEELRAKGII